MMDLTRTSRFISMILRHKPEEIGITLDEHGWADVRALIEGVNKSHPLTMEILEEIVRNDEKGRYSFNEDHTLIRANQGHSIPVDVELKEMTPPEILYHGTGEKFTAAIDQMGLEPFVGDCFVARLDGDVQAEDAAEILRRAEKAGAPKRILIAGKATVTEEAALVFAEAGILLLGNESQTVGPEDAPMKVHQILLGSECVLLEGIVLDGVHEGKFFLNAAPLNLGDCDGAPCRAYLIGEVCI